MMVEIAGHQLSIHAEAMVRERELDLKWIEDSLVHPEQRIIRDDRNLNYIKTIQEFGGRRLRIVVNPEAIPPKIVTIFFDRRLKEIK